MEKRNACAPEAENGKPILRYPVIVEGKYDKIKLASLFEGQILATDGFRLFNDAEKRAFLKRLSEKSPLILLTDSDHAGMMIRNRIKGMIPKDRLIHLYTPQVKGKEKRKETPSKEGFLGVEGSDSDLLRNLLAPYTFEGEQAERKGAGLRRIDLYERGYEGGENAAEKRKALCKKCDLPENLSTSALLEALNLLYTEQQLSDLL